MSEETVVTNLSDFGPIEPSGHRKSHFFTVDEYTIDGMFIRTWDSMSLAADKLGISIQAISHCVRGLTLYISKIERIFLKSGDSIEERLKLIDKDETMKQISGKRYNIEVDEYSLNGKILNRYDSITKAATINHTSNTAIMDCCRGDILFYRDRIYLHRDASIKERLELIRQKKYIQNLYRSIDEYACNGRLLASYRNASEVSNKYGISVNKILDCCFGNISNIYTKIYLFSGDNIKERLKTLKKK